LQARTGSIVVAIFRVILVAALAHARTARAADVEGQAQAQVDAEADIDVALARAAPPPVDGPALRLAFTPTRLYVDATYARSDDLSALPYVAGSGTNVRFALGGSLRWRRFAFTGEVPFTQVTTLTVTAIPGGAPIPQDARQTAVSLGDVRVGAEWTEHLTPELVGGLGLRGRLATHTTAYQFHLVDGSIGLYTFPYYFHIEPTFILGGAFGDWTFTVNQGALVIVGPDGNFADVHFVEPTIYFWDAHYALSWAPLDVLSASLELCTDVQLNHVAGADFQKLNDVKSAWVAPALSFHVDAYRFDLLARFGLTRSADLFGVIEYAGTRSFMLRATRVFN
jgi:hypothetical protein